MESHPPRPNLPPLEPLPPVSPPEGALRPAEGAHEGAEAGPNPCESLTAEAIQETIDAIVRSRQAAEADNAANGSTGRYASAARDNLQFLRAAEDKMRQLQSWLRKNRMDSPFVSNSAGAYAVHNWGREALVSLHYGRHWATISTIYHQSADAHRSFELTTEAVNLVEPLTAEGGRCYVRAYFR